jgi:hypothetical protein
MLRPKKTAALSFIASSNMGQSKNNGAMHRNTCLVLRFALDLPLVHPDHSRFRVYDDHMSPMPIRV